MLAGKPCLLLSHADRSRTSKWPFPEPATERRVALLVVLVFVVAGTAWILSTDILLYSVVHDKTVIARVETAKGWTFVVLAAALLFAVTLRSARQLTRASRALSAILESIGDGVLLLGRDRTICYANPASVQMLATEVDEFRGMSASEFSRRFHVSYPDGRVVPPDQFVSQRVFDEPGPLRYKAVVYPPGLDEVILHCTAAGVRQEIEDSAFMVVSVMHDITAVEQQERLRNELFASAAHAVKTPVSVIKGASQLLSAEVPAHLRSSVAMIERQCARIDRQVDNLLAFSRMSTGTLQLHPDEVELGPIVEDVTDEAAKLSHDHDIDVQLLACPHVHGDRERLAMVLRNVIHAALRGSKPGAGVLVRLERRDADAEIAVSYRPDPSKIDVVDAAREGTEFDDIGVSRHVTMSLVEAHGGTLVEQSDRDHASVRIHLPVTLKDAA